MKNDRVYIVCNNDSPVFYSFDENEANEFAKKKQAIVELNKKAYKFQGTFQWDGSNWHVHGVPPLGVANDKD